MRNWVLRDSLLRALVWFGTAAVLMTEVLSVFHLLRAAAVAICWCLAIAVWIGVWIRRTKRPRFTGSVRFTEVAIAGVIAVIAAIIGLTALIYPPNSADAMAYHMPRVVYWAQAQNVAFFPTPYLNQIMLQPMTEYVMLHTYLLTGGDRLINPV